MAWWPWEEKYFVITGSIVSLFLIVNLILELRGIIINNISLLTWSQGVKVFEIIFFQLPLGFLYFFCMFYFSLKFFLSEFSSDNWKFELAIFLGYPICTIFICFKLFMLCGYKHYALANQGPSVARSQPEGINMYQSVAYHIPHEPAYVENANSDPPAYSDLSDHADQNGILPAAQERRDSFVTFDQNNSDPPAYSDISDQIDN